MWVIDFEASGLSKQSYPIEVGVTNGADEYQSLIKPMPHWSHWSTDAQAVHSITRATIEVSGQVSASVAAELNTLLAGSRVYCDSAQWDGFWCNVLFSDNGIHCEFEILDIRELLAESVPMLSLFVSVREGLENSGKYTTHRALDDARIIWKALHKTIS